MAIKLKKLVDSPPGTIISSVKSMIDDPQSDHDVNNASRWLLCDGQTLDSVTNPEYTALYNVIGTKYGGSGASDFKVPNMHNSGTKTDAESASATRTVDLTDTVVLRGGTSANFTQLTGGAADQVSNRNNTKSGTLSGTSANVNGNLTTTTQSNLSNTSVSGTPGVSGTASLTSAQLTLRHWPAHTHQHSRCARNRQNNSGYRTSGGQGTRHYRSWWWSSDSGGTSRQSATGGGSSHNHSAQVSVQSVSGNIDVTHNAGATVNHNFQVNVSGTPSDTASINAHANLRFYIKY